MILSPTTAARVLGVTLTPDEIALCADVGMAFDLGRRLEYAARTRAIERHPLSGPATGEARAVLLGRIMAARGIVLGGGRPHDESAEELDAIEAEVDAAEPHDGGTDGAPPAAVRHIAAGALVASLVTSCGFAYGDPPWLPIVAGPIRPVDALIDGVRSEPIPEEATQATRGRYGVAEAACQFLLGMSTTRDPDGPSNDSTPEALHEAAVDLAIDCLCDEGHHVAEIVAEAAALLLLRHGGGRSGSWATARARRMCSLVGARREDAQKGATHGA